MLLFPMPRTRFKNRGIRPIKFTTFEGEYICAKCRRKFGSEHAVLTHYGIMHMHATERGSRAPTAAVTKPSSAPTSSAIGSSGADGAGRMGGAAGSGLMYLRGSRMACEPSYG
jgi:hypothetical protein